jgi:hypothetical protein
LAGWRISGRLPDRRRRPRVSLSAVHVLELTDDELRLLRAALHSFFDDFGHEEADVVARIRALMSKLPEVEPDAQHG